MIVYPRNTVTYLRNNQAVSWLGFEFATTSHKSNVLTITPPSHVNKHCKVVNYLNRETVSLYFEVVKLMAMKTNGKALYMTVSIILVQTSATGYVDSIASS